jgi:hypothetical protein
LGKVVIKLIELIGKEEEEEAKLMKSEKSD